MANFSLDDYVQVNERVEKFYEKYPNGRITTDIILNDNGTVIFKAYVYREKEDEKPSATGHAMEKEGSSFINKTSHIENCETSAVGRALAMLGFEIKKSIASREEVENAKLQQQDLEKITKEQALTLKNTLESMGVQEEDIQKSLKNYNVTKIEELNQKQYADILIKLNKNK